MGETRQIAHQSKLPSSGVLHDLATACSTNHEDCMNLKGKDRLEFNISQYSWTWHVSKEGLEVEDRLSLIPSNEIVILAEIW